MKFLSMFKSVGNIMGFIIKYAPLIIVIVEALKMIQDKTEELKTDK